MTRRHRHLDGTEHAAGPSASAAGPAPRMPREGLVDARLLVVALAVSSPAVFRLTQGLVSVTDVLTRYLLVAVGCVATGAVVRWVWPLLSGEQPDPGQPLREAIAAGLAAPPPGGSGPGSLDELGGDLDATTPLDLESGLDSGLDDPATALLGLGSDGDLLELSDR